MNITDCLKRTYEELPQGVKFGLSPLFVKIMIYNKEFRKTKKEIEWFEKLSEDEQKAVQLKRLKEIMQYAYAFVPYYHELFDLQGFDPNKIKCLEDIHVLPLLEKENAIQLGEKLYSQEKGVKYYRSYTGGSSGQSLTVMMEKNAIYRERAFTTHIYEKYGFDLYKTRTIAFIGHNHNSDFYFSPLKNEISISPFRLFKTDEFHAICDDIENFGATFMIGYPSSIYSFARLCEANQRKPNIRKVVYSSENCLPEEKTYIEKVLGCSVSAIYGHTERACLAEINDDQCVFHDYYGYTELVPTETENEYRVVCTGFINKKMPLIRYATDDVVQIQADGSMHLIGHRQSEVHLISKNGQRIFKGALTLHLEQLKKVRCYQFYQDTPGKAELRIVEEIKMSKTELEGLDQYLKRRCEGLLDVEIRIVDDIQLTRRGKYQWAINAINT